MQGRFISEYPSHRDSFVVNDVVLLHGAYLRQRDNVKQTLFFF